jgi:hypothetical protein
MAFLNHLTEFFQAWYGKAVSLFSFVAVLYYGVPKVSKTWDWYMEKCDAKVLRALGHETLPRLSGSGVPIVPFSLTGRNLHRVKDLVSLTGRGPRSVQNSLKRLAHRGKAEIVYGEWSIR